ncbi:MAG TPA: phospholipid carrier-dependent glycosyltransferase, partial [Geobacteraceae bacterium]|nr:phospholipid carrier-dependent glycosyltransferase [Geobacteraceae bacterium]
MRIITEWLTSKDRPARRDSLILFIMFVIPFFQTLGRFPLIEPDEGRYAEIPREMLERCDFVTPLLNYVKYFEKPPLHYWLNALFMSIFGRNE